MFRLLTRLLPLASAPFVLSDSKQDRVNYLAQAFEERVQRMKREFGTQMMSFPNVTFKLKGTRYSASFTIDDRRGTLPEVLQFLEKLPNTSLSRKDKQKVQGLDCWRFDFQDKHGDFSVTLVGPNNAHFFQVDYTGERDLAVDLDRLSEIYQKANKPREDLHPSQKTKPISPSLQRSKPRKDPLEALTELGAKVYLPESQADLEWSYLAGYEEAKQEIEDTIMLALEHPEIYDKITETTRYKPESNRPRAVLFEGPPGTGKTTSAKIIAQQVKIPMIYVPLEAVISKWYGEAEKNLGQIFDCCKEIGKCIIFIDEIDSLAQSRDREMHEATRRMLSVFLRYLDGFDTSESVLVICATNRRTDLDPALQSRFSKVITFPIPDTPSRVAIFRRYARHLTDSQLEVLGQGSQGLAGRDIKSICEDAERRWAARMLRGEVSDSHVDFTLYSEALRSRLQTRP